MRPAAAVDETKGAATGDGTKGAAAGDGTRGTKADETRGTAAGHGIRGAAADEPKAEGEVSSRTPMETQERVSLHAASYMKEVGRCPHHPLRDMEVGHCSDINRNTGRWSIVADPHGNTER